MRPDKPGDGDCIENGGLLDAIGKDGGADAVGGGLMNIDVEVGGGGAIGGFINGSFSLATVSLTFAANVCDTTVAELMPVFNIETLGDVLFVDIIIAFVYDIVVLELERGTEANVPPVSMDVITT